MARRRKQRVVTSPRQTWMPAEEAAAYSGFDVDHLVGLARAGKLLSIEDGGFEFHPAHLDALKTGTVPRGIGERASRQPPRRGRRAVPIDDDAVERIARRVVDLLRESGEAPSRSFITAQAVATRLNMSLSWVYENQELLGAMRLGEGPHAPLRFDPVGIEDRVASCSTARRSTEATQPVIEPTGRPRGGAKSGTTVDLLPVRRPRRRTSATSDDE